MLLLLAACAKEKAAEPAAAGGAPYALTSARDGESLRVEVKTANGFHVNDEYPVSFTPETGARVALKDALTKTACADDASSHCSAAMSVPNVAGTLAFSVCSKENCLIEKVQLAAK